MKRTVITVLLVACSLIIVAFMFLPGEMRLLGRPVWHTPKRLIDYELDGPGTNNQVFDIYTFSHVTHGIIFYNIWRYLGYRDDLSVYISVTAEILWELFENTPFIINRYRKKFARYGGDSIVNIIGDVIFTVLGVYLAYLSPRLAAIYLVLSEIVLYPFRANFLYLSIGSLLGD